MITYYYGITLLNQSQAYQYICNQSWKCVMRLEYETFLWIKSTHSREHCLRDFEVMRLVVGTNIVSLSYAPLHDNLIIRNT